MLVKEFTDEIRGSLRTILGGVLPHNNYDAVLAPNVIIQLNKLLKPREVSGMYNLLYKFIMSQYEMKEVYPTLKPELTEEVLEVKLELNLQNLVLLEEFDLEKTMAEFGLNLNRENSEQFQEAINTVYTATISLYNELMEEEITTSAALIELDILRDKILESLSSDFINLSAELLTKGLKYGKNLYVGASGLQSFSNMYMSELEALEKVLIGKESGVTSLNTLETHNRFNKNALSTIFPMFNWGIQPIDECSPIMNSDIVTIIGDEGTGKTHFVCSLATKCIMSGKSAIIMTGESSKTKIYHMVLSHYIYLTENYKYSWKDLISVNNLPKEDQLIVNKCIANLAELGGIHLVTRFTYETFRREIVDIVKSNSKEEFGAVFVDHVGQLRSNGSWTERGKLQTEKQRVDFLYYQAIELGDDLDLPFIITAHTGSEAASRSSQGKSIGTRIGGISGNTTKDADIAIWMHTNETWRAQSLVQFVCKKFRESAFFSPFIIKIDFSCSYFEYSDVYQIKNVSDEDALDNLEELC